MAEKLKEENTEWMKNAVWRNIKDRFFIFYEDYVTVSLYSLWVLLMITKTEQFLKVATHQAVPNSTGSLWTGDEEEVEEGRRGGGRRG